MSVLSVLRQPCLQTRWRAAVFSTSSLLLASRHDRDLSLRCFSTSASKSIDIPKFPDLPRVPSPAELVSRAPLSSQRFLRLMRMDKPTGTMLLFWPSAWSIALATPAGCLPSFSLLALFAAGALMMRSSACVINDLIDKDLDKQVERTRDRPLASGEVHPVEAVILLSALLSTSLAILCQLKTASILVGASSMALVVAYPLAKRYTDWPQVLLGATLNWGVLIAWAHLMPPEQWIMVLPLYAANCLHTFIYDTIYAHQDKRDDVVVGVKSSALALAERTKPVLGYCALAMTSSLALSGLLAGQTWPYYLALAATGGHVGWQVATVNIQDDQDCGRKFKTNASLGFILFSGIVIGNLLKEKEKRSEECGNEKEMI